MSVETSDMLSVDSSTACISRSGNKASIAIFLSCHNLTSFQRVFGNALAKHPGELPKTEVRAMPAEHVRVPVPRSSVDAAKWFEAAITGSGALPQKPAPSTHAPPPDRHAAQLRVGGLSVFSSPQELERFRASLPFGKQTAPRVRS